MGQYSNNNECQEKSPLRGKSPNLSNLSESYNNFIFVDTRKEVECSAIKDQNKNLSNLSPKTLDINSNTKIFNTNND